uniref:SH3 domain-containing protein n=1 Tax=Pelodiscus sinensis TaxID=13735 RepID=K7FAX2_PELSI
LVTYLSYANVYRELEQTIRMADAQEDLRWFRSTSGPGMPMNWPQFEEWNSDLTHTITRREKSKKNEANSAELLPGGDGCVVTQQRGHGRVSMQEVPCTFYPLCVPSVSSYERSQPYTAEWSDDEGGNSLSASEANGGANPFEEETAGKGARVRALYDYDGQEQDELSFKAGDELTKLGEEDEQGWCKGRLDNGQLGLYPANYVESI